MQTARAFVASLFAIFLTLIGAPAMAKGDLVIGVAQFPSNLHTAIGSRTHTGKFASKSAQWEGDEPCYGPAQQRFSSGYS